ncbi:MAG: hypothetical protein AB7F59_08470 [Bdellovibrionales bacterium]
MYFLIGLFIFTMLVIGINFCFLLVGGTPFHKGVEFAPVKVGKRTYTVERFAVGVSTTTFGVAWLAAWFYFLVTGWNPFLTQIQSLLFHVVLQLIAGIALVTSGIGIFKQWRRSKGVFITSMGLLIGSLGIAMAVYGPRDPGDTTFMYLFGMWTLVVGGFLTIATYLLDRLMHEWDEQATDVSKLKRA